MDYRIEHDALGEMQVPADAYWGAQTQRSLINFPIGTEKMPREIIRAFAVLKKAAAVANERLGRLDGARCALIGEVCDEILAGKLDAHFPLAVWQTGSGTQSNMNFNEVIANRANELIRERGMSDVPALHPNDTVNMSQSSNDTFPTAIHIAALLQVQETLLPAVRDLIATFKRLEAENEGVIKSGRTHLQDAVPIAFSQEISGWRGMLEAAEAMILSAAEPVRQLALGGTAVGTGLNAPAGFAEESAKAVSEITGESFFSEENKFHALTAKDACVFLHGAYKALAANMMKIANDVRWLASGPRCGLGEITIPANEPGSSIMPGKINPTQCEQVTMVAVQVMGNDAAVGIAASQGNFELNVFMPVIAHNLLQSGRLLADSIRSFNERCAGGIEADRAKMREYVDRSLMLVTALNPHIGYENAAKVSLKAYREGTSLKEAALSLGLLTEEEFDRYLRPEEMI